MSPLAVSINGENASVEAGTTVLELIEERGRAGVETARGGRGLAVAINGEVVPRSSWATTRVEDQDAIEILRAVGGG
jgi:sulfur carrier protein